MTFTPEHAQKMGRRQLEPQNVFLPKHPCTTGQNLDLDVNCIKSRVAKYQKQNAKCPLMLRSGLHHLWISAEINIYFQRSNCSAEKGQTIVLFFME